MDFKIEVSKVSDNVFHHEIKKMTLFLYNELGSRVSVDRVITTVDNLISNVFIPLIKNKIDQKLSSKSKCVIDDNTRGLVQNILQESRNPFKKYMEEHQRFKIYQNESVFLYPLTFKIGEKAIGSHTTPWIPNLKNITAVHLSLEHKLKVLFELPGVYDSIRKYMKILEEQKNLLSNVMQGELWRKTYFDPSKEKYPVIIQADDFEPGNCLGPWAGSQKMCGVYVLLPFLPPHLASKLHNILVTSIFYSKDRAFCGNKEVFKMNIEELNRLSTNGLQLNVQDEERTVYFECMFIGGDNLGMNGVCGFTESFTTNVEYWCRICRATGEQCGYLTEEVKSLLRDVDNYASDLLNNTGGVKEECCFHALKKFHITVNKCLDLMHDLLEGTIVDTIGKVLTKIIIVLKIITESKLNERVQNFDYGDLENDNKPGIFSTEPATPAEANSLGSKTQIKMKLSASQALCLARYLGLMIGDLIPDGNKYWKLYLILRKIVGIVTSPQISEAEIHELENLIKSHHELKLQLFGQLKPKDHFLTHLPALIRLNGPPIHFWAMPCERKHTELKDVAVCTSSKINVPLTIGIMDQLRLCLKKETFVYEPIYIERGPKEINKLPFYLAKKLNIESNQIQNIVCYKNVSLNGKKFKKGSVILINVGANDEGAQFCKINGVFEIQSKIYFTVGYLENVDFCDYYHAYEVYDNNEIHDILCIDFIPKIPPFLFIKKNNKYYVAPRYDI